MGGSDSSPPLDQNARPHHGTPYGSVSRGSRNLHIQPAVFALITRSRRSSAHRLGLGLSVWSSFQAGGLPLDFLDTSTPQDGPLPSPAGSLRGLPGCRRRWGLGASSIVGRIRDGSPVWWMGPQGFGPWTSPPAECAVQVMSLALYQLSYGPMCEWRRRLSPAETTLER